MDPEAAATTSTTSRLLCQWPGPTPSPSRSGTRSLRLTRSCSCRGMMIPSHRRRDTYLNLNFKVELQVEREVHSGCQCQCGNLKLSNGTGRMAKTPSRRAVPGCHCQCFNGNLKCQCTQAASFSTQKSEEFECGMTLSRTLRKNVSVTTIMSVVAV